MHQAQAEVDRLAALPYGELALTSAPASSSDPQDPGYKVSGSNFAVRSDLSEPLVLAPGPGATAKVEPGPEDFAVGTGGGTIAGTLHRYVTWRDESCPLLLCEGEQNTKRVIVAVTLVPLPGTAARAPIWVSTIVVDPDTAPPGSQAPPGGGPGGGDPVTADSFYLYDTPCGQGTRQPQSGSHSTRDTASTGADRGGELHLRAPGARPPAGPDGRVRASGRQQHPRLPVLGRPRGRLPGRARDGQCRHHAASTRTRQPRPETRRVPASGASTRGAPGRCRSRTSSTGRSRSRCSRPCSAEHRAVGACAPRSSIER